MQEGSQWQAGWIGEAVWRAGGSGRDEGDRAIGQEHQETGQERAGNGEGEEVVGEDTGWAQGLEDVSGCQSAE